MNWEKYPLNIDNMTVEELEEVMVADAETDAEDPADLVVYNDDVNTFEWVIQCFEEILSHTAPQAEQCAMIIHFKGKASVKKAPENVLKPLKDGLSDRGLSAVIEHNN